MNTFPVSRPLRHLIAAAAAALMQFLRGQQAQSLIRAHGYGL